MKKDLDEKIMKEWAGFLLAYKFALDEVRTKLNILNEELQIIHDYNPIEHIKTRIKKPDSIINKLKSKQLAVTFENARQYVRDIAGVRVVCSFTTDIYEVLEMICSQDDVEVLEIKDYVKNPKPNGYKSLHAIIRIPVFLSGGALPVTVEIQIRTIAMDFWASLEHKIYYKYNKGIPSPIQTRLKEAADIVSALDSKMLALKNEIT
ncbi:GTP pyrophosphokinase [Desulforamulus ferrireducens]|uniref:GTP pyrophosphokinase n=1 Tax=Desulforamulus ferrireducens TaxID=1833852 RepID=A0A1S6IV26_9FIRM|nr:GTP pyrophosphokinase family protein [Desulforamulus ferrireducens]AQS58634.1 GTP pyrophosphokinase [Desulforamulus ferrireducens]